jgi:hypothetical protein
MRHSHSNSLLTHYQTNYDIQYFKLQFTYLVVYIQVIKIATIYNIFEELQVPRDENLAVDCVIILQNFNKFRTDTKSISN